MRKTEFANGEYYHVFNRGTDKREIFSCSNDYVRFLETIRFVNDQKTYFGLSDCKRKSMEKSRPPRSALADLGGQEGQKLVSIICYCLNPNHYHLILRQEKEKGISLFMSKLGNSYTKYFNVKSNRSGALFQGKFKAVHIASNEKLLLLSVYVNANHFIHGYESRQKLDKLERKSELSSGAPELSSDFFAASWAYSSLPDYLGKRAGTLCDKFPILGQFKNIPEYAKFILDNAIYLKKKKEMEKMILE